MFFDLFLLTKVVFVWYNIYIQNNFLEAIMSIKNTQYVDIPEHTIIMKEKYVYLTLKSFRNDKGKPDNQRVIIGRYVKESNKMIPNLNYFKHFEEEKAVNYPDIVMNCGTYIVVNEIAKEVGLDTTLNKVFGEDSKKILSAAHYMMVTNSNVMYYLPDWMESNVTFSKEGISDVAIGRLFHGITEEKKKQFFKEWVSRFREKECIAYDVTSISSYARGIENVEYGYNRDKETLPQINYGMYYGIKSNLPYYCRVYPGSINDKTHLKYMMADNKELNLKNSYFVMDKGFYSKDNLIEITKKGHQFIIPIPGSLNIYKKYVDKYVNEIKDNYEYRVGNELMYCKSIEANDYGFRMNIHIFYNQEKASENAYAVYKHIDDLRNDIANMETLPSPTSSYYDFFNLELKGNHIIATEKKDMINKELSRCGFFAIAETIFNKTSSEILETYRNRDTIEKCFDDLKNELDMNRLHCSTNETTNGKIFVTFISLILLSKLRNYLSTYCSKNKLTLKNIYYTLDKIKAYYDSSKINKISYNNPLTKSQKQIFELLNIDEKAIDNYSFD